MGEPQNVSNCAGCFVLVPVHNEDELVAPCAHAFSPVTYTRPNLGVGHLRSCRVFVQMLCCYSRAFHLGFGREVAVQGCFLVPARKEFQILQNQTQHYLHTRSCAFEGHCWPWVAGPLEVPLAAPALNCTLPCCEPWAISTLPWLLGTMNILESGQSTCFRTEVEEIACTSVAGSCRQRLTEVITS